MPARPGNFGGPSTPGDGDVANETDDRVKAGPRGTPEPRVLTITTLHPTGPSSAPARNPKSDDPRRTAARRAPTPPKIAIQAPNVMAMASMNVTPNVFTTGGPLPLRPRHPRA